MFRAVLFTFLVGFVAGCVSTFTQQCDPENKSDYCEDLRRGVKRPQNPAPAKNNFQYDNNGRRLEQHPNYKTEMP